MAQYCFNSGTYFLYQIVHLGTSDPFQSLRLLQVTCLVAALGSDLLGFLQKKLRFMLFTLVMAETMVLFKQKVGSIKPRWIEFPVELEVSLALL